MKTLDGKDMDILNLKKRYRFATIANLKDTQRDQVYSHLETIEDNILAGKGLYLYGPNGTGKSYVASILLKKAVILHKLRSYWITPHEIREAFFYRHDFLWDKTARISVYYHMMDVQHLVIDDLGKEYHGHSGYYETCIKTLVRARYDDNKVTTITSNMTPEEVTKYYGGSFGSLVGEYMIPVVLQGEDIRKIGYKELEVKNGRNESESNSSMPSIESN